MCVSRMQFLWLLGDRGIPASWRNMEGHGIHTFVLAAKDGKQTYVKFKWEPKAGECVKSVISLLFPVAGPVVCLCTSSPQNVTLVECSA